MEKREGKREVEKLLLEIGVRISINEMRSVGGQQRKWPKMWLVELGSERK